MTWNTRDKWAQLYAKTPATYAKAKAPSSMACWEDVLMPLAWVQILALEVPSCASVLPSVKWARL